MTRMRHAWSQHKDAPRTLGILMAAVAAVFIIGIVVAFNSARNGDLAQNRTPATSAQAPAPATPETTGSGNVNRPALATPQNTRP
jgi:hypothetical protein